MGTAVRELTQELQSLIAQLESPWQGRFKRWTALLNDFNRELSSYVEGSEF